MKKILSIITTAALSFSLVSCDALFDNLEGDLSKISGENLTETEDGLSRMMAAVYGSIPMGAYAGGEKQTDNAVDTHGSDIWNSQQTFWDYLTMRDVNNIIKKVEEAYQRGVVSETVYKTYIAEARFIRAYFYFGSVKVYGGVPIVTEPLDDKYDGGENAGLYIPRSTEKDTWDFIIKELTEAAADLPEERTDGVYRANKWAALGLKSRVALYAASVSRYWNTAPIQSCDAVNQKLTYMEESYAKAYYDACISACEEIINSGKFGLYNAEPTDVNDAVNALSNLFMDRHESEWIFGKSYKNGVTSNSNGFDQANSPSQSRASSTAWQWARYSVNADLADLYDDYTADFGRTDGTLKTRTNGNETAWVEEINEHSDRAEGIDYIKYPSLSAPFAKKDARFQAWVMYPGTTFRDIEIIIQGGLWDNSKGLNIYGALEDKITIGGKPYYMYGDALTNNISGYYAYDDANDGNWYSTGFGIRKFLNPDEPVLYSQNPWYDIRYAEILLNYCEAIVERDGTNAGDSKKHLNAIRRRANFRDQVDATLENVLKERRLELVFEEDRPMTLHRRREYYRDGLGINENTVRRHAIIPVLDGRNGVPEYIMVRAYMYKDDLNEKKVVGKVEPKNYYYGMPNYVKNKITPNPSDVL